MYDEDMKKERELREVQPKIAEESPEKGGRRSDERES